MTPYELYQFYLNKYRNPEESSLVKQEVQPTYTLPEVLPVSETGGDETTTGPTSTGKGIGSISMSDIGKAIGFAVNPALGIASLGFSAVTGKTPMQAVQDTLASIGIGTAATGPTAPGAGMGFGGGYATDVGFGGMGIGPGGVDQGTGPGGCDAGPSADQGTGPGGCDSGTAGPSADSGTGPGGCSNGGGDGGDGGGGAGAGGGDAGTGPGGCGYATGGRVGFAVGTLLPPKPGTIGSNYLPYTNFLDLLKGRTSGDFNEEGQYVPFNYQMYVRPEQDIFNIYNRPMYSGQPNAEQLYQRYLGQTPNEDFLNYINSFKDNIPTEDFSGYLNGFTPNWSPGDPAPEGYEIVSGAGDTWIEPIARTLFPQTNLQQIKETATSPTQYNIEATKDLVENLPGFVQPFAPAAAGIMSIPYDAIQAYQRMQPGSGLGGFAKAYAAERPLQSAYERFVGASGPLAENINKAVSSLNPFQKQQYMQYAAQNPEQARAAAQRNQEFIQATQRENQVTGGRVGFANGSLDEFLKSTTLVSPSGKSYNYDFIKSLPGTPSAAAQKFGREAIYGTTVNAGDNDITTPGKYASYYDLQGVGGDAATPSIKDEYRFIQEYVLQPENLVRDYGLEGAIKILTPYRKAIAPAPKAAPKAAPAPEPKKPFTIAEIPSTVKKTTQDNLINIPLGSGVEEDPSLNKYTSFIESYKPTSYTTSGSQPVSSSSQLSSFPISNYETFIGDTGPFKQHLETAVSGLPPFYKQQYQTYALENPRLALEAALQNIKFLTATGNMPGYEAGGRVGYANGSSDKIDYWITVQEIYDNAGGEAGTGLGLIDFANKYFPKMADGGRPGYLQGGLVSLLR